jgi:hypothetical protein
MLVMASIKNIKLAVFHRGIEHAREHPNQKGKAAMDKKSRLFQCRLQGPNHESVTSHNSSQTKKLPIAIKKKLNTMATITKIVADFFNGTSFKFISSIYCI